MVNQAETDISTEQRTEILGIPDEVLNWCTVSISEVLQKKSRLEASFFGIEGKHAREILKNCMWKVVPLKSREGFIDNASYPTRFKRIYVDKKHGIPFLLPSQINEVYPKPSKFISPITNVNLDDIRVRENNILMTRSGTIGDCTVVTATLKNTVFSDDVIRIVLRNSDEIGYVYAFLKTKIGRILVNTNNYGAVVEHIEPEHLESIPIPDPSPPIKQDIQKLVMDSFTLRDDSNNLIDEAKRLLVRELKLPPLDEMKPDYFNRRVDLKNFSTRLATMNNRIDASYHVPIVDTILAHLKRYADKVTILGDPSISKEVFLPGRFKRIYVEEGQGIAFFGGKQLNELDPSGKKYLSMVHHSKRIKEELALKENMILITRSGTIGKINIVSKHWQNWLANEHVIRIIPSDISISGYIYVWLSTDYGHELVKRFTYGAVVDEIDNHHVSKVQIPILKNKDVQARINHLVLEANKKRYEAYLLEQKAIKTVNDLVIYANKTPSTV